MPVGTADAPTPSVELTAWRPKLEQVILASSDVLDVMVVRPALVYGRSGAIWSMLFGPIIGASKSGSSVAEIPVDPGCRTGLIHVDDFGSGFHAAIDKLPLIAGTGVYPIFDLVTCQESMRDILDAVAREVGFKGTVQMKGAGDHPFVKAVSTSSNTTGARARTILGWEPKKSGFVSGMDVYARAWAAKL